MTPPGNAIRRSAAASAARARAPIAPITLLAALAALPGCVADSPFAAETESQLRRAVIDTAQRELREAQQFPQGVVTARDNRTPTLGIRPESIPELLQMAGPQSYTGGAAAPPLGTDLLDRPVRTVTVSLERVVRTAIERNVAVQFARLGPAVAEAQVIAAEAAFDWSVFSNLNYTNTDSPRVNSNFGSSVTGERSDVSQSVATTLGLRRTLIGGGRLTIQHELGYSDNDTPGLFSNPNPANQASYVVQWDQPLLRNLGSEVSQAEIRVARNAERSSVQTLRRDMIRVATDTERTYWQLVQAYADLRILQRLLDRGEVVRDQLRERVNTVGDANQAQVADAVARVERRRADVLRAQTQLRLVSDRIKALISDPDLPAGSETVLLPADAAIDEPVRFSLYESLVAAIRHRPEVQQAILSIDDASIRQVVSANQRLPDLSLRLQTRFSSLDDSAGAAYGSLFNGDFVDYLVGLAFEMPIGNRRAEAELRRRRLERMQSVLSYRNTVQEVVTEVKSALDRILLNYRLIAQTRDARLAASESLRVLVVEKDIAGYTVERLDVELNREESLAQAEREEVQALIEYNTAIADLFQAMGTSLERNGVRFVVPTSDDVLGTPDEPPFPTLIPSPR